MLTVTLVGDKELIARLDSMPDRLRAALRTKVTALALKLEAKVKGKLTNDVLNVKTGNLRRSIHSSVDASGDAVTGKVASSGDVKYAAIHEYGGVIKHPGGTAYFVGKDGLAHFVSNKIAFAYGNWKRTQPHSVTMPERSFLRSSLTDMKEEITDGLNQTVMDVLKQ